MIFNSINFSWNLQISANSDPKNWIGKVQAEWILWFLLSISFIFVSWEPFSQHNLIWLIFVSSDRSSLIEHMLVETCTTHFLSLLATTVTQNHYSLMQLGRANQWNSYNAFILMQQTNSGNKQRQQRNKRCSLSFRKCENRYRLRSPLQMYTCLHDQTQLRVALQQLPYNNCNDAIALHVVLNNFSTKKGNYTCRSHSRPTPQDMQTPFSCLNFALFVQ